MTTDRSILLVDDEENILSALTRLLRREGYQIFRAISGPAGLELLSQQQNIGVIVSDQRMPEMTGVEFLSQVKQLYPDTVRIVLSGYTDLNSVTDAINKGEVYKFLTKPWDDELLRDNIREAFHHVELRRENERLTKELRIANERLVEINKSLEHRVAEEVRASLQRITALEMTEDVLNSLPLGLIAVDDQGVLTIVNRFARQILGDRDRIRVTALAQEVLPGSVLDLLNDAAPDSFGGPPRQADNNRYKLCKTLAGPSAVRQWTVITLLPAGDER